MGHYGGLESLGKRVQALMNGTGDGASQTLKSQERTKDKLDTQ